MGSVSKWFSSSRLYVELMVALFIKKIKFWQYWETWPRSLFYGPLSIIWGWYCLRSRSFWFFSSSNPTLTLGGFEGETKREMYEQLPPDSYPSTLFCTPQQSIDSIGKAMNVVGLRFPVAVKPDVGMKGLLFRKIDKIEQLAQYHAGCPVDYMVQAWVDLPIELGVFYCRYPGANYGEITGITRREPISVLGDGSSTLVALMEQHPRAKPRLEVLKSTHASALNIIIPKDQTYMVTHVANRCQGAQLHNLQTEIDQSLRKIFDDLSHYTGAFYYGRYDIKCASLEDLKQGKNYQILEFNGAGAAPHHVYHCGLTLFEAYREILRHWKYLFEISKANHERGFSYWTFWRGFIFLRQSKKHFKQLELYETIL